MQGTYRKKGDSWEYRTYSDLPDGSRVQKAFCRKTKLLAKAAYEDWIESGKKEKIKRQTVAGWGEEWLEVKRGNVSYRTYANYSYTGKIISNLLSAGCSYQASSPST